MRAFLGGVLLIGLLGGATWMVNAATAPYFEFAKAKAIAASEMEKVGGGELLNFQHNHGTQYWAIYRKGNERFDIYVEGGQVSRVQTGNPLCNDAASR